MSDYRLLENIRHRIRECIYTRITKDSARIELSIKNHWHFEDRIFSTALTNIILYCIILYYETMLFSVHLFHLLYMMGWAG